MISAGYLTIWHRVRLADGFLTPMATVYLLNGRGVRCFDAGIRLAASEEFQCGTAQEPLVFAGSRCNEVRVGTWRTPARRVPLVSVLQLLEFGKKTPAVPSEQRHRRKHRPGARFLAIRHERDQPAYVTARRSALDGSPAGADRTGGDGQPTADILSELRSGLPTSPDAMTVLSPRRLHPTGLLGTFVPVNGRTSCRSWLGGMVLQSRRARRRQLGLSAWTTRIRHPLLLGAGP